jgi:hypothetical protein
MAAIVPNQSSGVNAQPRTMVAAPPVISFEDQAG